jgi:peptide/nickel transport system substrate-binding protein
MDHTAFHAEKNKDLDTLVLRGGGYPAVATAALQNEAITAAVVKPDGTGGNNFSHYGILIPGIDDLFNQAMNEADLKKRLDLVGQMELKILEDMPLMSTCSTAYVVIRAANMNLPFKIVSFPGGLWRLTGVTFS